MSDHNQAHNRNNSDDDIMDMESDMDDDEVFHMADDDIDLGAMRMPVPPPMPIPPQFLMDPHRFNLNPPVHLFSNDRTRRFSQDYRVLSVVHLENRGHHQNLENGGKVILPPSALQQLSRNSSALMSPMMFKAKNPGNQKITHCGVLEFIAEEDLCYMPTWMMENLGVIDMDLINIEKIELPTATFAKFQPQSVDFLEISNPKAMLENSLRFFACLTKDDIIAIHYNSRIYKLCVLELQPSDAVNIIECDMNVDFAAPVGYVSPSASKEDVDTDSGGVDTAGGFVPFKGSGTRLNGKPIENEAGARNVGGSGRGLPDMDWKIGSLQFKRKFAKPTVKDTGDPKFRAFDGEGRTLKRRT